MTDTRETAPKEGFGAQLWGAVKNVLTEEDPVAAARRAKLQGGKTPADAARPASASTGATSGVAPTPLSPMALALMNQVLAKPTAYTALTEKLAPLETIVIDERTRYQAAYALIRTSRSVEQVVQAIDMQHVQALDAEVARFAAQLQDKERAEIDSRSQESLSLANRIDTATAQAARMREDIESRLRETEGAMARDRERLAQLAQEIDAKRQELAGVQHQFDAAAHAVKTALGNAKATVLRHLA